MKPRRCSVPVRCTRHSLHDSEESAFFFEKKKQKTFAFRARVRRNVRDSEIKVFCFFFSKKKNSFSLQINSPPPQINSPLRNPSAGNGRQAFGKSARRMGATL